jgi:hypothetical protein
MAAFRTTKTGRRVVCGTPDEIRVGQVMVSIGSPGFPKLTPANVVSVGEPFTDASGRQMVYGYLQHSTPAAPVARTRRRQSGPIYSARAGGRCRRCGPTLDENPNLRSDGLCFDCMP